MMASSDDLPDPLAPSTPILAAGNIEMLMPERTSRSGGWNRRRSRMVKMNWGPMAPKLAATPTRNGPGAMPGPLHGILLLSGGPPPGAPDRESFPNAG